ncbi:uncharacterized protein LOC133357719 [Lethenteron reissneri]|uniref:uncharacterized protein LOC133357719 n=1 Tax=Lethenteron reissneri TaxID=7753 RepID=UPI002AB62017|nr:uncharacterized protein LOC133357719 [Lethenteron reissneri]
MATKRKSKKLDSLVQKLQDFMTQSVGEEEAEAEIMGSDGNEEEAPADAKTPPLADKTRDKDTSSPSPQAGPSRSRRKPTHVVKVVASDEDNNDDDLAEDDDARNKDQGNENNDDNNDDNDDVEDGQEVDDDDGGGDDDDGNNRGGGDGGGSKGRVVGGRGGGGGRRTRDKERPAEEEEAEDSADASMDVSELPEGTVVVEPEAVQDEKRDAFRGPEFRGGSEGGGGGGGGGGSEGRSGKSRRLVHCAACAYAAGVTGARPPVHEMLNTSRAQVADAHTRLAQNKLDSAEEILRRVRNTNPTLNESQVLEVCQLVQRNQQADRRRFEGNYQELLARHQMIFQAYQSLAQQTAQMQAQAMLQQQQHQQQLLTMQAAAAYRPHIGGLHGLLQQQQQQRGGIGVGGAMPGSSSGAVPQTGDGSQQEPILL